MSLMRPAVNKGQGHSFCTRLPIGCQ